MCRRLGTFHQATGAIIVFHAERGRRQPRAIGLLLISHCLVAAEFAHGAVELVAGSLRRLDTRPRFASARIQVDDGIDAGKRASSFSLAICSLTHSGFERINAISSMVICSPEDSYQFAE